MDQKKKKSRKKQDRGITMHHTTGHIVEMEDHIVGNPPVDQVDTGLPVDDLGPLGVEGPPGEVVPNPEGDYLGPTNVSAVATSSMYMHPTSNTGAGYTRSGYTVIGGGNSSQARTIKESKAEELQYAIKPDGLNGLVVFYFNVDGIEEEELSEYLDQLIEANDDLAQSFGEMAFEPIWFSFRGNRASHIEIWPLVHSKEKKIKFLIHRDRPRSHSTRYDSAGYYRSTNLSNYSHRPADPIGRHAAEAEDDKEKQILAVIKDQFVEKYPKIASELEKQEFTIEWVTTSYPTRIIVY